MESLNNMNFLYYLAAAVDLPANDINIPKLDANSVLNGVLNTIYVAAGIIAVVAIILGGYRYVVSSGDATSITKAKNMILYAVIGLIVIIAAFAVTWFVIGRFA